MGCAFGKDASPAPSSASVRRKKERTARPVASDRKSQAALSKFETAVVDAPAAAAAVRAEKAERLAGERTARPVASDRKSQAALSKFETAVVDAPAAAAAVAGRRRQRADPSLGNHPGHVHGEQVAAGWPSWLSIVAGEAIKGWTPRRADTFEKLAKIGQGTYSNVYKARHIIG
ncbi:probable serine/threonine-protein kinase At1g54610 [Phoenix dactylifera]|uniref:Probable serine/threonine-protein kinase At1g54610 n=1 Tax=Phoenix dactylifera TaxID=42345 RepID=A0A8B8ZZQ5_PHODC|nr:probable serine/threonine-protein kinase At1g54610 [Phoenix dactylifera]